MRVIHVFYEIKFSGAEIMYANATPLFKEKGIELVVLNTSENLGSFASRFESMGVEVLHKSLPNKTLSPIFIFNYFLWFYKLLKQTNIDVIHIHRNPFYWWFSLIGFFAGKRTVRTIHSVFKNRGISKYKAIVERFIARELFKITFQTIGDSVYQHELDYFNNPSVKINNWYDDSRFYPAQTINERAEIREKINIPQDSFVIMSAGGCTHNKNHHDIIKALQLITQETPCLYLHLGSGQTEQEEKDLSLSLGIDDSVRFLDNKPNVRDYLIASDVFIMSSGFEGLSIAAIEAMACGLPSVLYNSTGLRDLIKNDDNGFLIDKDYHQIAQKVMAFKADPDLAKQKSSSARDFVIQYFSMIVGVKAVTDLYTSN